MQRRRESSRSARRRSRPSVSRTPRAAAPACPTESVTDGPACSRADPSTGFAQEIKRCCDTRRDGRDCHFKPEVRNPAGLAAMRRDHEAYHELEDAYCDGDGYSCPVPTNPTQKAQLKQIIDARQRWMRTYMCPACLLCDSNAKNHVGRKMYLNSLLKRYNDRSATASTRKRVAARSKSGRRGGSVRPRSSRKRARVRSRRGRRRRPPQSRRRRSRN